TQIVDQINFPSQGYTLYSFTETATGSSTPIEFGFRQDPSFMHFDDVSVAGNGYVISGSHTYTDEGDLSATATFFENNSPTVAVTLTDDAPGTATATANSTANVGEGDFGTLIPTTISATEGISFSGAVGSFTDGYTGQVASDFTATIDWGDGTTDVGVVSGGNGLFTISGTHTYAEAGRYTVIASLTADPP